MTAAMLVRAWELAGSSRHLLKGAELQLGRVRDRPGAPAAVPCSWGLLFAAATHFRRPWRRPPLQSLCHDQGRAEARAVGDVR